MIKLERVARKFVSVGRFGDYQSTPATILENGVFVRSVPVHRGYDENRIDKRIADCGLQTEKSSTFCFVFNINLITDSSQFSRGVQTAVDLRPDWPN